MIQKAFNVGNSVVVTIPAKLGIKAGTRMTSVKKTGKKLIYEILDELGSVHDTDSEDYISRVTGGFKVREGVTPAEIAVTIKELEEHPYDKSIRFS